MEERRGRYTRGYLAHIEAGQQAQFVTWRLKDSLPGFLFAKWKAELQDLSDRERNRELHRRVEEQLDSGHGSRILSNSVAAKVVQDSLIFGHPERYRLSSWVIMPTHVHCLLTPCEGWTLSVIMKSLKGYTSREIGKKLNMPGKLWQEEPFDVLIRDQDHFYGTWKYIEWNPVKAKLCGDPKDWAYSSANTVAYERLMLKDKAVGLDVDV
jgi:REP element-mobilizing transposase RayT